jgi:uracil-DNA glycosylase
LTKSISALLAADMDESVYQVDLRTIASTLRWWEDAGVSVLIDDQSEPWLTRGHTAPKAIEIAPPQPVTLPATLSDLITWMMEAPEFDFAGPPHRRLAPFGSAGAPIMILTDMPELGDVDAHMLFSGETGELLDRMLGALSLDRSQIYCAPLCPGRTPSGRIDDAMILRLQEIARHHIALAAPKRLWLLGQTTSRAILGLDDVAAAPRFHIINHIGGNVEAIASWHPRLLLQNPRRKAGVWADMQLLAGDIAA